MDKYIYKGMRVYFDAPSPAESKLPSFKMGPNFQWIKLALIFTDGDNQYSYAEALKSTGTSAGTNEGIRIEKNGKWEPIPAIKIADIQRLFGSKLKNFDIVRDHEKYKDAFFVNVREHPHEKAGPAEAHYNYIKFSQLFNNLRYELIGTTGQRLTPLGMVIGKEAMELHILYHEAVKTAKDKTDYFTGGFDIMKKLQEKITGRPAKKPEYETGGFDIMKKLVKKQREQQQKLSSYIEKIAFMILAAALTKEELIGILNGLEKFITHAIDEDYLLEAPRPLTLSPKGLEKLRSVQYFESFKRKPDIVSIMNIIVNLIKTAAATFDNAYMKSLYTMVSKETLKTPTEKELEANPGKVPSEKTSLFKELSEGFTTDTGKSKALKFIEQLKRMALSAKPITMEQKPLETILPQLYQRHPEIIQ